MVLRVHVNYEIKINEDNVGSLRSRFVDERKREKWENEGGGFVVKLSEKKGFVARLGKKSEKGGWER